MTEIEEAVFPVKEEQQFHILQFCSLKFHASILFLGTWFSYANVSNNNNKKTLNCLIRKRNSKTPAILANGGQIPTYCIFSSLLCLILLLMALCLDIQPFCKINKDITKVISGHI